MSHSAALEEVIQRVITASLSRFQHAPHVSALIQARWQRFATKKLLKLGQLSHGNKLTVFFNNGDEAFEALWKSLCASTKNIFMEMYTIDNDNVGKQTLEHLASARNQGKEVYVVYDGLGSLSLPQRALAALRGSAFAFNPIFTNLFIKPWNNILYRTHRKLVSIDGKIGFIGGMNISKKYAGRKLGTGYFKDIQVKIEGPAAAHLENVAYESLKRIAAADPSVTIPTPPIATESGTVHIDTTKEGAPVLVVDSNLLDNKPGIQKTAVAVINTATTHCYITTPYFLPPTWLKKALMRAAKRGVDVRIITAGRSDVPAVRYASQHIYSAFLKRGVKIYEMFGSTLHAKMFTVDGVFSCAGSFNFDLWSGNGNMETNIGMFDPETTQTLEQRFIAELKTCREVRLKDLNRRSYLTRFMHWLSYHALRLVSPPKIKKLATDMVKTIKKKKNQMKNKITLANNELY